ncbi:hypothetical protein TREMEDRAFT_45154 [Tremella mesenterica DSM 1558]|uniref:uncharacterized protein n=1 Tax=Tremella mesenterica (strain ATCC 24925 / CBS 8224 / DSM 1558 / NBRC 9311 / NRRL Y-6157 / RJB 2259-6 / UBC 559-6) TaxID=578456 RepID=UPI0003F4A2D3|nr:uncharacterized protein TREMEDRAFT_45154 [Tremella mesenterica DSM 1558]EIW67621.1 hypothetical protein TREMEDRAFT_45154 [Tremella mesenterica DSM 1558]
MRSSTVLLLSLRSVAHETIKNLVLAGIGRLIIMDDGVVTPEDLGGGFLFREEDGAVGKLRTEASSPQIASLNPLVALTAVPTLAPFIRNSQTAGAKVDSEEEMVEYLQREKVDVVVCCDMTSEEVLRIDAAARNAGVMFYAAGSFGFYGYVFADLGDSYEYVFTPPSNPSNPPPSLQKKLSRYSPFSRVLDRSQWHLPHTSGAKGGSPYRGLTRSVTKDRTPGPTLGLLALWELEKVHGRLPLPEDSEEMRDVAEGSRRDLGVNEKALPGVEGGMIEHLTQHAAHFFPPTLAILGGLLAQDVLRALSKKDKPIVNLLVLDSMGGTANVSRWAMDDAVDA